jgi:cobalamin biosynthesis protein CobT
MAHSESCDQLKRMREYLVPMPRSFDEAVKAIELCQEQDFDRIRRCSSK